MAVLANIVSRQVSADYFGGDMSKLMSKLEIIQKIAEQLPNKMTRDDIKGVLDALADVGRAELKQTGVFLLPGFAKFEVTEKPATEAREGVNPFTKEPMTFAAKPASKVVRARPIKALKDAL
jgi:DNA-binding protein HU-beta